MHVSWKPIMSQAPPVTDRLQQCDERLKQLIIDWNDAGPDLLPGDMYVDAEEVVKAAKSLASYKAAGVDGVTNETLKAMGGVEDPFIQLFADACNSLLRDPTARPIDWNYALVCMLPKTDKPKPKEFRPITLLSCVKKLMQTVVNRRMDKIQREDGSFTSDAQSGFKNEREALEASLRLVLAAQRCKELGIPLYVIFYDTKKAFDCVPFSLMATTFDQKGVEPYLQRYLHYDNTGTAGGAAGNVRRLLVGTNIDLTDSSFDLLTGRGAAQGGVISPLGYNTANDPLTQERKKEDHKSIALNTSAIRFVPNPYKEVKGEVAYADDYTQFDTSAKRLASRCCKHTQPHIEQSGMVMNSSPKTVATILGGGNFATAKKSFATANAQLYDIPIELVDGYNLLGVHQQRRLFQDANDGRGKLNILHRVKKLTDKGTLARGRRVYGANNGCPLKVGATMARAIVYASLFYGVELFPINENQAKRVIAKYAKGALSTYDCVSTDKALTFLGWPTVMMTQSLRTVTFALRCCTHPVRRMAQDYTRLLTTGGAEVHKGGCRGWRLPWVAHVRDGVKHVGITDEFNSLLRRLTQSMNADANTQLELRQMVTEWNDELKKANKRREHQCVRHSFKHAHHSFIFYHMRQFDPIRTGVPLGPCYVCGAVDGDTPLHLVQCKHAAVVSIIHHLTVVLRRTHKVWHTTERGDDDELTKALLLTATPADDDELFIEVFAAFDKHAWKEIALAHGRLYSLRKALRDQSLNPSKRLGQHLLRSEVRDDLCPIAIEENLGKRFYHVQ
jgi:hypothetical protein